MRWKKYIINTTIGREDEICAVLYDHGITSLQIEDEAPVPEAVIKEGGWFGELMPDPGTDDSARVIFYIEEDDDFSEELELIRKDLNTERIDEEISDEEEWRDKWKKYFHAFSIGDIFFCPTWEEPEGLRDGQTLIRIDPGIAFGTGKHESTRGCIEFLQRYLREGDNMADIGFGSGILSVAALKLGAGSVSGVDIAEECLDSVRDNFAINGISGEGKKFYIGDITEDEELVQRLGIGTYDVCCANILADIIIGMRSRLYSLLRPGGMLLASGIIDFKEAEVVESLSEIGFETAEFLHLGEWTSVAFRKGTGNEQ